MRTLVHGRRAYRTAVRIAVYVSYRSGGKWASEPSRSLRSAVPASPRWWVKLSMRGLVISLIATRHWRYATLPGGRTRSVVAPALVPPSTTWRRPAATALTLKSSARIDVRARFCVRRCTGTRAVGVRRVRWATLRKYQPLHREQEQRYVNSSPYPRPHPTMGSRRLCTQCPYKGLNTKCMGIHANRSFGRCNNTRDPHASCQLWLGSVRCSMSIIGLARILREPRAMQGMRGVCLSGRSDLQDPVQSIMLSRPEAQIASWWLQSCTSQVTARLQGHSLTRIH